MDNNSGDNTIDLHKILLSFTHNIVLLLAVTIASAMIGFVISSYFISPTYSASTTMYVNNSNTDTKSQTITQSDLVAATNLVDTYSVILKSHSVLQNVIDSLNLNMNYETLNSKISISSVNKTQVMQITVKDKSSQQALAIVEKIGEFAPDAIMNSMDSGSVKVVDQPWTSGRPIAPNKSKTTLVSGLCGFLLCFIIVILSEVFNNKFKSSEDVQEVLGLPVIGIIPLESETTEKNKKSGKVQKKC